MLEHPPSWSTPAQTEVNVSTSTTVRPASFLVDPIADNLRAAAEMLAYPHRTVLDALDHLGVSPDDVFFDLIDLSGAAACKTIEAELLALSWKQAA